MKDIYGSSGPVTITDPALAQIIANRTQLRRLAPFMGHEMTVGQAAEQLGLTVTATYKIARRFVELGLLHQTRQEQRAGRAIKYYRAPGQFFIPFSVLSLEQAGEHNRQVHLDRFNRNLAQATRQAFAPDWGMTTGFIATGEAVYEITSADGQRWEQFGPDAPILLAGWNLIKLNKEEARNLQRQLADVFRPYFNRESEEDTYLIGVFMVHDFG